MGGFILNGGFNRPSIDDVKLTDDLRKLGLGSSAFSWFGDELPSLVGRLPAGYITRPLYRIWTRGTDAPGYFSYGPYKSFGATGTFNVLFFVEVAVATRGGPEEDVFTVDVVDASLPASDPNHVLCGPTTFKVKELSDKSSGYTVYTPSNMPINSADHQYESRLVANGGADLKLWEIRWEADLV